MISSETSRIAAALIRRENRVLLVRQQGQDDAEPLWALPGGIVEPNELLSEALTREVREEVGLEVQQPSLLVYVAQLHNPTTELHSPGELPRPGGNTTVFVLETKISSGEPSPSDPDDFILEAEFCPLPEALRRLEGLPWRFMREPIVAYLRGEAETGSVWLYRRSPKGNDELIERVPPRRETTAGNPLPETREVAESEQHFGLGVPPSGRPNYPFRQRIVILGCLVLVLALLVLVVLGIVIVAKGGH